MHHMCAGGIPSRAKLFRARFTDCWPRDSGDMCAISPVEIALSVLLMACAYIYFALYFYYLFRALFKLKDLPRWDNKMVSLQVRLQVHSRTLPCPADMTS